jgi:asparagine synthetase B (glutamine-hydrolysing)
MCGITGFVRADKEVPGTADLADLIDRMCQTIRHRGPDDQGVMMGVAVST